MAARGTYPRLLLMEITQGETFPFGKVSPFFCALFPASAGMVPGLVRTAPFPAVILVPSALFVPVSRSTRGPRERPGTAQISPARLLFCQAPMQYAGRQPLRRRGTLQTSCKDA